MVIGFDRPEIEVLGSNFISNTFDDSIKFATIIFAPSEKYNQTLDRFNSNANVTVKDSCFMNNKFMTYSLAESTNNEDAGITSNNYASQNEFKLTDTNFLCSGFTKQNTVNQFPICSKDGFKETLCPLWEAPSTAPSTAAPTIIDTDTSAGMILSCNVVVTALLIFTSAVLAHFN